MAVDVVTEIEIARLRPLAYTYEVREHVPGERFVMSTEGPAPDQADP